MNIINQKTKPYNSLYDLLNEYADDDINFLKNTKEYKDLDNYFKSFFGVDFTYDQIHKLFYNCFIYKNYIIKFSSQKIPINLEKMPELVNSYFRQNYTFKDEDIIKLNLGVEIQKYLKNASYCNEEEIFQLYKSLRNKGYIWMDANIGNALKYKDKCYIVDLEFIYPEKEAIYINQSKMSKEFEIRYKNESSNYK